MSETNIVRQAAGDRPEVRHLIDLSGSEQHAPSGVFDEATGREMTNSEFVDFFGVAVKGAERVIGSSNGLSSEAVKTANSELAKDRYLTPAQKAAAFQVSKLMVMPPNNPPK